MTMTSFTAAPMKALKLTTNRVLIGISIPAYIGLSAWILDANDASPRLRFDLTPLLETTTAIQIHVVCAILTFAIGVFLLAAPKGFTLHRTFGWAWVVAMAVTALSSFFITSFTGTHFSPIHALSAWTIIGLPMAIAAVRRRKIAEHRKQMTNMFVGGMLVAGLFSFLPGRLMWSLFFA